MLASPVDALLPIAPLARAAEAPSRGDREGSAFGPALEQAYATEKARESAAPAEAADEPAEAPVDETSDSNSTADERAEAGHEAGEEAPHAVEADEASDADDESTADKVEISALASAIVAVNEAQTAAIAGEAAAAAATAEVDAVSAADGDKMGDAPAAEAVPAERDSSEGQPKASRKVNESLPGTGVEAAAKDKATKTEKREKVLVESLAATVSDESATETQTIEKQEIDASRPLVEEADAKEEGASEETDQRPSRTTKAESAERVNLPPVERTAELAVAIERHVALIDQSSAAEGGSAEAAATPPVDATNGGTSTQRAAATLDRLAATSLRRSDDAAQADGGPQIDRPRFVQRVEGALRAAQQRDGRVQVRLAPPELGVVHIELAVQNGVMTAKLEAETAAARNALLDNLPALRERLAEQNIRVEKFDVDVRRDSQGGGNNNGTHDGRGDHGESNSHGRRGRPATTPSTTVAAPKAARTVNSTSDSGLDVRI